MFHCNCILSENTVTVTNDLHKTHSMMTNKYSSAVTVRDLQQIYENQD